MRKSEALSILGATPRPNLRAAWDAEMPNGMIVFIGWAAQSKFDQDGNLVFCPVQITNHEANNRPGGRRRGQDIAKLLKTGASAYLLLADGEPGAVRDGIRDELYRVSIQNLPQKVNAVPINRTSLTRWLDERHDEIEAISEKDITESTLDATEKESLVKARRGQGIFREHVYAIERCCRLTGVADPHFLRASHIRPWAISNNTDRLDGNNGLMLAPHVDHLFDGGFITFEKNGNVWVAPEALQVMDAWGLSKRMGTPLTEKQDEYMEYHREHIFLGQH